MDYMTLFPAYSREKPRFSALAEAILQQVNDLYSLIPSLQSAYSVSAAAGAQLDDFGASVNIPRQSGWSDETYRQVLLRKLKRNGWDGMNDSSFDYLEEGETFCENNDWTVTVQAPGLPLPADELLPIPIGTKALTD